MKIPQKFMLLGSGELGKEFVIAAKRLGNYVVAVDKYNDAPAMQIADESEVVSMLDSEALEEIVNKHKPDFIVPEIEAICTEKLQDFENRGINVIPNASAVNLTMNRDKIRDLAAKELGLRTAKYAYADSLEELMQFSKQIGYPNVVKPIMSSSGKGQSVAFTPVDTENSWHFALEGSRGKSCRVIVEEFIQFESEITLLTVRQRNGQTLFCPPIGHRQERGDYQESWQPAKLKPEFLKEAENIALKVTDALGGVGIFGVEFFITPQEVIFSELSPRPHDTGMVTLISQNINEFELHLRAILGLPIPRIEVLKPSASSVILAGSEFVDPKYSGLQEALLEPETDLRIFAKPDARRFRRMGVALAKGETLKEAVSKAKNVASQVQITSK